jgi:hypothetical protein
MRAVPLLSVVALATLTASSALADDAAPAPAADPPVVDVLPPEPPARAMADAPPLKKADDPARWPLFAGIGIAFGWVTASHPQLATSAFTGAVVNAHLGYTLGEHFAVALDLSNFETGLERLQAGQKFDSPGNLRTANFDSKVRIEDDKSSGWVRITTMNLTSMGARFDYAPFGRDGLYLGATVGPAVMSGLSQGLVGFGATGRAGLRGRVARILTFALEGGFTGQTFGDTSSTMPYVGAVFRPYF